MDYGRKNVYVWGRQSEGSLSSIVRKKGAKLLCLASRTVRKGEGMELLMADMTTTSYPPKIDKTFYYGEHFEIIGKCM